MLETIQPSHRQRQAIVYVRQSTPQQAIHHQESLDLQYDLRDKAHCLGWPKDQIKVIDCDIGLTGRFAEHRPGFQQLVSAVSLQQVGIIFAYDVTRLARNCTDWYQLLDLCGLRQCLVGDQDGVYDPATPNGRLILGLKGLISELELHTIKARLTAGLLNKARRGDLVQPLPIGLIRESSGKVGFHPHQEVQSRIRLIYSTFLRLRSSSQVLRLLQQEKLLIPSQDRGQLVWRFPTLPGILGMLKNPAYAGAFVYGRTQIQKTATGVSKKVTIVPSEWKICIKDKYPAYISWETYETILAMLKENHSEYERKQSLGVPRAGPAMVHGLVYCGECGHQMKVKYTNRRVYLCDYWQRRNRGAICQQLGAEAIDAWVVEQFFKALDPAELNLYEQALDQWSEREGEVERNWTQQLERLRYEARLAERQYQQADPENRLVTGELERRWESALRALEEAEETWKKRHETNSLQRSLTPEMRKAFREAGQKIPKLWESGLLKPEQKKAFLRCLMDKVVLRRKAADQIEVRLVWRGGDTTTGVLQVRVAALKDRTGYEAMVKEVVRLSQKGMMDSDIALTLTKQGYRSPSTDQVLPSTVKQIRYEERIYRERDRTGSPKIPGFLTVSQMAKKLRVKRTWIYDRIREETIKLKKHPKHGLYLFSNTVKTLKQFQKLKLDLKQK